MKTFVVRLFIPSPPGSAATATELQGLVEEIGSGRRASFAGRSELLAFLAQALGMGQNESGREAATGRPAIPPAKGAEPDGPALR